MAAPRLPFLYPNLLRSVRSCEPTSRSVRFPSYNSSPSAGFHSSHRCEQDTFPRRYGPATEPRLPPPSRPKNKAPNTPNSGSKAKNNTSKTQPATAPQDAAPSQDTKSPSTVHKQESNNEMDAEENKSTKSSEDPHAETPSRSSELPDATQTQQKHGEPHAKDTPPPENPLEAVLQMPPPPSDLMPATTATDGHRHPHLTPPPYVHHFDTYGLVKDLEHGGFSEEHAITVMKAVRGILQDKLDLAQSSLTSKSDIENEQYLFKAACSELQSSLQTARNSEIQTQRTFRSHLQHEVDILTQRMNQELAGLSDDLKGMFNDHKMTTRELQRSLDTGIQELNYKITVSLNSDGKSEVEGLRWVLTRRAALAIATSAFMIILFLKYYSVHTHELKKKEAAAKEAAIAEPPKDAGSQTEPTLSNALASETLG